VARCNFRIGAPGVGASAIGGHRDVGRDALFDGVDAGQVGLGQFDRRDSPCANPIAERSNIEA
jgi:hypothetical protein